MSDDLIEAMAEAIHYALGGDDYGVANAEQREEPERAARAALDAIIAQGGVTTEEQPILSRILFIGGEGEGIPSLRDDVGKFVLMGVPAELVDDYRDLMARAIVTACAERDAEIERLHDQYSARWSQGAFVTETFAVVQDLSAALERRHRHESDEEARMCGCVR